MAEDTLYDVSLSIRYSYDRPAGASRTLLRILPLGTLDQEMIGGAVSVDPRPTYRRDGLDFFGNATTEVAHDAALSDITFAFAGRVRRRGRGSSLDLSCRLSQLGAQIAAVRSLAPWAPHHFVGASPRVPAVPEIADFARRLVDPQMSALSAVAALSQALHREFAFDPTATEVTTGPAEAFRNRRGVCQDISHVMIAALRAVGIPAGYVSGFLRTIPPAGQARLEGADAMHAWVRAWCGAESGWVEIDPTNDIWVGSDHIAVAVGRDYADVSPVRGSVRSAGSHRSVHSVTVAPL